MLVCTVKGSEHRRKDDRTYRGTHKNKERNDANEHVAPSVMAEEDIDIEELHSYVFGLQHVVTGHPSLSDPFSVHFLFVPPRLKHSDSTLPAGNL